ncbi:MAG: tripartite tricarboxylate transporter permease, partial [Elusimicrobiota bacterium]|nr:tripartite tricarboxylate transporter permease [Elusimicrobiota bacterium]
MVGNAPTIIFYVLLGTVAGSLLCAIPALHIYNVAGIAVVLWMAVPELIPYYALAPFFMSLVVSFAFINTIPMTFLNTADESAGASMLPSTDMVTRGRGKDAAIMTGMGTLTGAFMLLALYPFFWYIWPYLATVTGPHLHWILGLIIVHYIMSEWPKGAGRGPNAWAKFKDAWRNVFAGMLTFTLAGIFGLIFISKPILPAANSFQNIMPVFIGLFAVPSIIQAILSDYRPPRQYNSKYVNAQWGDFGYGMLPGFIGGMLAAYLPAVTAGIGAMLAGHTT